MQSIPRWNPKGWETTRWPAVAPCQDTLVFGNTRLAARKWVQSAPQATPFLTPCSAVVIRKECKRRGEARHDYSAQGASPIPCLAYRMSRPAGGRGRVLVFSRFASRCLALEPENVVTQHYWFFCNNFLFLLDMATIGRDITFPRLVTRRVATDAQARPSTEAPPYERGFPLR
jgi:hypothetical protein